MKGLYPDIQPYNKGFLKVSDIHELYFEECGNPKGVPVVFIHGGPGAGISDSSRRFFDPEFYRIILFDQRGAPKSRPFAQMEDNTPHLLASDIEKLKNHLNVKKWLLFGGSWGSTLAFLYAQLYPQSCLGLILRGIWLFRKQDIDWFFNAPQKVAPDHWREFIGFLPQEERDDYFENYYNRIMDPNPEVHMPAARAFAKFEADNSTLIPNGGNAHIVKDAKASLGIARAEIFYMRNNQFENEGYLIDNMHKIKDLPVSMVHGRYDIVCPIEAAFLVKDALPNSKLVIVNDAGHSAYEPGTLQALINETEEFKINL